MGIRKRIRDFKDWCPQPPSHLPVKLRNYTVPIAVVLAAALAFGVFLSLSNMQNVPTQPAPQLPNLQTSSMNSTQPLSTPTPTAPATPTPTSTPPVTSPPTLTQVTAVNGSFELTMSIEKTVYSVGEPVNITLTLTNISNQTVNVGDDAWLLDFVVSNGTSKLIYQHTGDGMMPMYIVNVKLQPGQNITDCYLWSQRYSGPNPGPTVSPGTYYIVGKSDPSTIVGNIDPSYELQTDPLRITIVNS
jgi:hypothetical protein